MKSTHSVLATLALVAFASPSRAQCTNVLFDGELAVGNNYFGIAVDADGPRFAVGAPDLSQNPQGGSGSAYVFELVTGNWVRTRLVPAVPLLDEVFGASVAIHGDTIVVGAPGVRPTTVLSPNPPVGPGAVYVFEKLGSVWTQTARLTASDGVAKDLFGWSVDVSGTRLLVGAPKAWILDSPGAVYAFELDPTQGWIQQQVLSSGSALRDGFGRAVVMDGARALVGQSLYDGDGVVFAFDHGGSAWGAGVSLPLENVGDPQRNSWLAIDGDHALVGMPDEERIPGSLGPGATTGVVARLERVAGAWHVAQTLHPPTFSPTSIQSCKFGASVALHGGHAAIGAPHEFTHYQVQQASWSFPSGGSMWVFERVADGSGHLFARCRSTPEWPWASENSRLGTDVAIAEGIAVGGVPIAHLVGPSHHQGVVWTAAIDSSPRSFGMAPTQLPLVQGGVVEVSLNAGSAQAGHAFVILGSVSGTEPGLPLAGAGTLPLNLDWYTDLYLAAPNTLINPSVGILDTNGQATAQMTFPALPLDSGFYATRFHHAFLTMDLGTLAISSVSNAQVVFTN